MHRLHKSSHKVCLCWRDAGQNQRWCISGFVPHYIIFGLQFLIGSLQPSHWTYSPITIWPSWKNKYLKKFLNSQRMYSLLYIKECSSGNLLLLLDLHTGARKCSHTNGKLCCENCSGLYWFFPQQYPVCPLGRTLQLPYLSLLWYESVEKD